jgi:YVTN family beta-propeller protein
MDTVPYKLLVVDTENSTVLLTDGESGEIIREWPFPGEYSPVDIQLTADSAVAYIPTSNNQGRGALFSISLPAGQLTQLQLDLPAIERFAAGPQFGQAVVATRDGALFLLDITKRSLSLFGRSGEPTACVGLATDANAVYTVWQHDQNGVLAIFSSDGQLCDERFLPGLPTNLSQSERYLYIPFTTTSDGEEGMLLLQKKCIEAAPRVISLHHCPNEAAFRIYPCHVAVTPDESTAYVVHEDSANVSVIDIASASVSGYIPVGRSLSGLTLLPDSQFAVAGSYMFADLSLIDLVNRRLLSLTDGERELFGQVAVLPGER